VCSKTDYKKAERPAMAQIGADLPATFVEAVKRGGRTGLTLQAHQRRKNTFSYSNPLPNFGFVQSPIAANTLFYKI
jgi:hypothetical protein